MKVRFHRFVLAEFNTHRVFSRNSASSRAIPLEKQLAKLAEGPSFPISWPVEQAGMQGGSELMGDDLKAAQELVERVYENTIREIVYYKDTLESLHGDEKTAKQHRLHKSVINRLIEPFMEHEVIVTATEWQNFFDQRCSPLAQPEIRVAAEDMRAALSNSTPRIVKYGEWHLPLIHAQDLDFVEEFSRESGYDFWLVAAAISVARCARVSYLTHEGVRDQTKDLELFNNLISANPPHWSPLEHVATPAELLDRPLGNFTGWEQLRHTTWELNPINLGEK